MDLPEIDQLRAFERVAARLHFGHAARDLHVTQSTISHRIRRLEEVVGSVLLVRDARRVQLTAAGFAYLRRARAVLSELRQGALDLEAAEPAPRLVFGYSGAVTASPLMHGVVALLRAHPDLRVELKQRAIGEQLQLLSRGELDLASSFMPVTTLPAGVTKLALPPTRLLAYVASRHPLARHEHVTMRQLRQHRWVELSEGVEPDFSRFAAELGGAAPQATLRVDALDATLALVASGLAVALLPPLHAVPTGVQSLAIRNSPMSCTHLFVREDGPVTPLLPTLMGALGK